MLGVLEALDAVRTLQILFNVFNPLKQRLIGTTHLMVVHLHSSVEEFYVWMEG